MLSHFIEFIIDYFTNLNVTKIIGGMLVLIGLAILGRTAGSGNIDKGLVVAIVGFIICSVGFVIIYYDIAKNKINHGHDELETLSKAFERKAQEDRKISTWHMNQTSGKTEDKNKSV